MRGLIAFLSLVSLSLNVGATEFEIFTLSEIESSDTGATVYVVTEGDRLLREINQQLSDAGVTTEETAKHFVTPELTSALTRQVTGLVKAARYQLKYFPAIVIDGSFVIYGTTDITVYDQVKP